MHINNDNDGSEKTRAWTSLDKEGRLLPLTDDGTVLAEPPDKKRKIPDMSWRGYVDFVHNNAVTNYNTSTRNPFCPFHHVNYNINPDSARTNKTTSDQPQSEQSENITPCIDYTTGSNGMVDDVFNCQDNHLHPDSSTLNDLLSQQLQFDSNEDAISRLVPPASPTPYLDRYFVSTMPSSPTPSKHYQYPNLTKTISFTEFSNLASLPRQQK